MPENLAKVSAKGQVVIPQRLRRKYGITKDSRVIFEEEAGAIKLLPPVKLGELCGSLDIDLEKAAGELEKERSKW